MEHSLFPSRAWLAILLTTSLCILAQEADFLPMDLMPLAQPPSEPGEYGEIDRSAGHAEVEGVPFQYCAEGRAVPLGGYSQILSEERSYPHNSL